MISERYDIWLTQGLRNKIWFSEDVHCIQLLAYEFPSSMLCWLQKAWRDQGFALRLLYASDIDVVELKLMLSMYSFQDTSILLINMDIDPSRKLYNLIINFCLTYKGHFRIILVVSSQHKLITRENVIEVPRYIDLPLFMALCNLFDSEMNDQHIVKLCFDYIIAQSTKVTVVQACRVIPYIQVVGRGRDQFFSQWLPNLLQISPPLFMLSQYLFAREEQNFYKTWFNLYHRYSDEFWLVYWSDQLWQAYCFILAMRSGQTEVAKTFTKGLPFSFIQRSWRTYDANLFAELLLSLYEYDCYIKQGGLIVPYELLFRKIFSHRSNVLSG